MTYNQTLRIYRKRREWSQQQVAKKLHISRSAYAKIENGQTQLTLQRLEQIAKIYNMSIDHIVDPSVQFLKAKIDEIAIEIDIQAHVSIGPDTPPIPFEEVTKVDMLQMYGRIITEAEYPTMDCHTIQVDQVQVQKDFNELMETSYYKILFERDLIEDESLKKMWCDYKKTLSA